MLAPHGAVWDLTDHSHLSQAVLQPTRLSPEVGFHKETLTPLDLSFFPFYRRNGVRGFFFFLIVINYLKQVRKVHCMIDTGSSGFTAA